MPVEPIAIPKIATIEDEIRSGLPMDRDRMDCARVNADFYRGENCKHLERREGESNRDFKQRPKRYSRMTLKAISELTSLLYLPGPAREVEGVDASAAAWLEDAWKLNHVNRVMQQADAYATLNDCCAIQVVAGGDDRPIRLYLWGAEEYSVFFRDDDPTEPWCVVTRSIMTKDRKKWTQYTAWTANEFRVYRTKPVSWVDAITTSGGTAADYAPELSRHEEGPVGVNPYGVLPFAYVWNHRPVDRFWGSGIGTMLREANADIDRELSDTAEHVYEFLNPKGFVKNVPAGTRFLEKVGRFTILPQTGTLRGGENSAQAEVFYLQATLGVEAAWWNVQKYANQTFHELNVPLSAVRDDQQGPTSGFQIVAEQAPLIRYTEGRQDQFAEYETDLARLILRVGGGYYPGMGGLIAAADSLDLDVTWTPPKPASRSVEMDDHERNDYQMGLTTRIGILMDRGMTREQAIARLERVKEDRDFEASLLPDLPDLTAPVAATDSNPDEADKADKADPEDDQDPPESDS